MWLATKASCLAAVGIGLYRKVTKRRMNTVALRERTAGQYSTSTTSKQLRKSELATATDVSDVTVAIDSTAPTVVPGEVVPAPPPAVPTSKTVTKMAVLKELKELLDSGVLTQSEFDEQKKEILARKDP